MAAKRLKPPSYRRHKASGQAIVTLNGKDIYLGPHGTKISRDEYDRVVGEWMANGRTLPTAQDRDAGATPRIVQVLNSYRKAEAYPASQESAYVAVIKLVARLYGRTPADEFGPIALKAVRLKMIEAGWKRRTINQRVKILCRIFKWAVEHDMFSAELLGRLKAVDPLKVGRPPPRNPPRSRPLRSTTSKRASGRWCPPSRPWCGCRCTPA